MLYNSNKNLTENSKSLRKNMTKEERHLWYDFLKTLDITVYRQKTIGNYIVDFCIENKKIIIEIDGTQHYEESGKICDEKRDKFLSEQGYKVLRYSNADVNLRFESVCNDILNKIN